MTRGAHHGFFLWVRDWLTSESVLTMSRSTRSMYIDLLCHQSLSGTLPADTRVLARLLGETHDDFLAAWEGEGLREQFELIDGRLQNARLAAEQAADDAYRAAKRGAGAKGGRSKALADAKQTDSSVDSKGPSKAEANVWPPSPSPSPSSKSSACGERAHEEPTITRIAAPSIRGAHLSMHPSLDTPEVRRALDDLETHRRQGGQPEYTPKSWERNLVDWERRGAAWLIAAIDTALKADKYTPFQARHHNGQPATPRVGDYRQFGT